MVLPMPSPYKHSNTGIYWLKQRVPSRLKSVAKGQSVTITVDQVASVVKLGDYVKVSLRTKTATVRAHLERDEPFFDELADILEGPLAEGHRTIKMSGGTVSLDRPRSTLVTFNKETLDWVTTRELDDAVEARLGNVTRYNLLSKNGRFYDQKLGRVVPFKPHESLGVSSQRLLSRSLDDANHRLPGLLEFSVQPMLSARGVIKRYILMACTKPGHLPAVSAEDRP